MKFKKIILFFFMLIVSLECFARPKVALVLSGGGARGYVHISTIKMIEKYKIPVDYVVGTSMGAIVGMLYAAGYSSDDMLDIIAKYDIPSAVNNLELNTSVPMVKDSSDMAPKVTLSIDDNGILGSTGIVGDIKVLNLFNLLFAKVNNISNFDEFPRSYRAVATDITNGETVVLKGGHISEAVRASMGIPMAFPVFYVNGHYCVDGGVNNNMPVDVAIDEFHPDFIISSDCTNGFINNEKERDFKTKLKNGTSSFSDIVNQISTLRDTSSYDINFINDSSDVYVFYDTTNYATMSFTEAFDIIDSSDEQVKGYEDQFKIMAEKLKLLSRDETEDQLESDFYKKHGVYKTLSNLTITSLKINGNERYKEGVSNLFYDVFKSYVGLELNETNLYKLSKKIEALSSFHGASVLYYNINKTRAGNELEIIFDFPVFRKHQLSLYADTAFAINLVNTNSDLPASFTQLYTVGVRYTYLFNPKTSLDSLSLHLMTKSLLKEDKLDFAYTHFMNTPNIIVGFVSPHIVLYSGNPNYSMFDRNKFRSMNYGVLLSSRVGFLYSIAHFELETGLDYTKFGKSGTSALRRERMLMPFITIKSYVGNEERKRIRLNTSYRVGFNAFVGADLNIFNDGILSNTEVPYSLSFALDGSIKVHPNIILGLDARSSISRRPSDKHENDIDYAGIDGMPGYPLNTIVSDFYLIRASLIFSFITQGGLLRPGFVLNVLVGQKDNFNRNRGIYDNYSTPPFTSLDKLNIGLNTTFFLSTSVVDILLGFGYEFMTNQYSVHIELW